MDDEALTGLIEDLYRGAVESLEATEQNHAKPFLTDALTWTHVEVRLTAG